MQTCIMSSLSCCIFRCSVFRYVTLVSFFFQTLLFNCNSFTLVANKYLLTYLLILKPVDFAGEVFHSQKNGPTDFGRFHRLKLKKPSSHKENTSERESFQSMQSLPAQEAAEGLEGLLNLPFLEDSTKRTRF